MDWSIGVKTFFSSGFWFCVEILNIKGSELKYITEFDQIIAF